MKSTHRTLAFLAASAPTAVLAQTGTVTTSPLAHPAPAMGLFALAIMVAALALVAARRLRLRPAAITALALTLTTLGAAVGYAGVVITDVIISGAECNQETTEVYGLYDGPATVMNQCPNAIRIDTIVAVCNGCESLPGTACESVEPKPSLPTILMCEPGFVLQPGTTCGLPTCGV